MNSLSFVPLRYQHFRLLHQWLQEHHVWQWWGEGKAWSFQDIEDKYGTYIQKYKIEEGQKPI
jgi:aminoglycoside 6'-N-acetyltransferase